MNLMSTSLYRAFCVVVLSTLLMMSMYSALSGQGANAQKASPVVTEEQIRLVEARTKCAAELLPSLPKDTGVINWNNHQAFVEAYCEKEN